MATRRGAPRHLGAHAPPAAEDIEEERRVFHVALTRCRSSASIISGSPPSPFLVELARPGRPVAPAGTPDVTADADPPGRALGRHR